MSTASRRGELLTQLFGDRSPELADRLDAIVGRHAASRTRRAAPLSQNDAWLIVYPDQFSAPPRAPLEALREVVARDLAPEVSGVHVLPFHPASGDGGFSVVDFDEVDGRVGSWRDIGALGSTTRLMVDAVVNHASAQGRWFREFLEGRPERSSFFRVVDEGADLSGVVRPRSTPLTTRFERADGTTADVWTTFGPDQVDLDYREPEVVLAMADVVLGYASRGADVIRLDAVAYVGKREGTSSIHRPETHALVRLLRACLDDVDPGIVLVTETNVPHAENVSYLGGDREREAQAVYQFALPPLVLHALATGDAAPLRDWAAALAEPRPDTTVLNFLASHDGVGLRPAEGLLGPADIDRLAELCRSAGGVVNTFRQPDGRDVPYELTSTWFDLCAVGHDAEHALRRHLCSHALMAALQGVPLFYVHGLFGSHNDLGAHAASGSGRDLNRARFPVAGVPEAAGATWAPIRAMLAARRAHSAFHPGAGQRVLQSSDGVVAVERSAADGRRALVVVNLGGRPAIQDLESDAHWTPLGGGTPVSGALEMAPWSSVWLDAGALSGA